MSLPGMTPFLEACGATGPLVVAVAAHGDAAPVNCVLHQPFAVIGRESPADVIANAAEVSRRHALLLILDGRAFVLDLASRTGLSWSGHIGKAGWLNPRQRLGIGPFMVSVNDGCLPNSDEFNPLCSSTVELPGLPAVGLMFTKGLANKGIWAMRCRLALVGGSTHCKVRLSSSTVSRYHCCLVRTPGGLWVVDLLGKGGIHVNGRQVRYTRLLAGDRLGAGRFEIEVVSAEGQPIRTSAVFPMEAAFSPPALRPTQMITLSNPAPDHPENGAVIPTEETVSASLLYQFAAMHNHMLDQFQQAMVRMVQVFGRMHREQITDVHEELKKLREVNKELQELRTQIAMEPRPASSAPVGVPVQATSEDAALDATLAEMEKVAATFSNQEWGEGSEYASPAAAGGDSARKRRGAKPVSPPVESRPSVPTTKIRLESAMAPNSAKLSGDRSSLGSTATADHEDIHAKLCMRMTTLQEERQSRWRKILGMLNSARNER